MRTPEFMFLLQFWTKVVDSVNRLSEYLQSSSIGLITAESLIECCYSGILEMRNDATFDNLERDAIELSKKCGGPEIFVEKLPHKKKYFDELAHDSVIEETRLRFNIEKFLQFVGYLFKSTERTFQKPCSCAEF